MQFTTKNKKIIITFLSLILIAVVIIIGQSVLKNTSESKTATVEIGRTSDNQPITVNYDLEYSFKDYTNEDLKDARDLNGKTIYATMFLQEIPDSHIFPEDMKGVTFVNSNLDNVYIPPGNTVIGGSQRRFQAQKDGQDWLIDENNNPIELLNKVQ